MSPVATVRLSTATALRPGATADRAGGYPTRRGGHRPGAAQPPRGRQEWRTQAGPVQEVRWVCGLAPHHGQPNDPEVVNNHQLDWVAVDT